MGGLAVEILHRDHPLVPWMWSFDDAQRRNIHGFFPTALLQITWLTMRNLAPSLRQALKQGPALLLQVRDCRVPMQRDREAPAYEIMINP